MHRLPLWAAKEQEDHCSATKGAGASADRMGAGGPRLGTPEFGASGPIGPRAEGPSIFPGDSANLFPSNLRAEFSDPKTRHRAARPSRSR